jgi:uncharacterized membrane protein
MTLISKEHYDLIAMFEKIYAGEFRLDKEDKSMWSKGFIYQHGDANRMFKAFRHGVAYGKAT